jgi:voltage-gated potassium channel
MKSEMTQSDWKQRLYKIIFESDTKAGRTFDIVLLIYIFASVLIVMLESVQSLQPEVREILIAAE